jgi:hypothetical protein
MRLFYGLTLRSAVRQKHRRTDHTDRHKGNDPHGRNWRPIVMNCTMKSKISRHDLLQYYLKAAFELVQCFVASLHRQLRRLAEAEKSAKLRSGCRITRPQLAGAKVSKSNFGPKQRKFPRHFKGHFSIGNVRVRILPGQPRIPRFREFPSLDEKAPPNAGFSHHQKSPETDVRTFWGENSQKSPAESRKTPVS